MKEQVFLGKGQVNPDLLEYIALIVPEDVDHHSQKNYTKLLLTTGKVFGWDLEFETFFRKRQDDSYNPYGAKHKIQILLGPNADSPLIPVDPSGVSGKVIFDISENQKTEEELMVYGNIKAGLPIVLNATLIEHGVKGRYSTYSRGTVFTALGLDYRIRKIGSYFKTLYEKNNIVSSEDKQKILYVACALATISAAKPKYDRSNRISSFEKVKINHMLKAVAKGYTLGQTYHLVQQDLSTAEFLDVQDLPDTWFAEVAGGAPGVHSDFFS